MHSWQIDFHWAPISILLSFVLRTSIGHCSLLFLVVVNVMNRSFVRCFHPAACCPCRTYFSRFPKAASSNRLFSRYAPAPRRSCYGRMTNKWKSSVMQHSNRRLWDWVEAPLRWRAARHQINLLHHWTFSLEVYCYHKSVFVRLSTASADDSPKRDSIASIQLGRSASFRHRRLHSAAPQMRPLT